MKYELYITENLILGGRKGTLMMIVNHLHNTVVHKDTHTEKDLDICYICIAVIVTHDILLV